LQEILLQIVHCLGLHNKRKSHFDLLFDNMRTPFFQLFRSTPPSRPNNIRGGNVRPSVGWTYVRQYVRRTKSLSDFNEIWYVHRGR